MLSDWQRKWRTEQCTREGGGNRRPINSRVRNHSGSHNAGLSPRDSTIDTCKAVGGLTELNTPTVRHFCVWLVHASAEPSPTQKPPDAICIWRPKKASRLSSYSAISSRNRPCAYTHASCRADPLSSSLHLRGQPGRRHDDPRDNRARIRRGNRPCSRRCIRPS